MTTRSLGWLVPLVAAGGLFSQTAGAKNFTVPAIVTFESAGSKDLENDIATHLGGRVEGGRLVVDSKAQPGDGKVNTNLIDGDGTHGVFVDVTADHGRGETDDSGAGPGLVIRYGKNGDQQSFYALLLTRSGYQVTSWSGGSSSSSISGSLPEPPTPGKPVRLAAREAGDGAEFFVNGKSVASLSTSQVTGSSVGLIVMGTGRYTFDNYGLNLNGDIGDVKAAAPVVADQTAKPTPPPLPPKADTPPPLPPKPQLSFWVAENGQQVGPFAEPQLRERVTAGTLNGQTLVWTAGMPEWKPAATVPQLAPLLAAKAPVPQPPAPVDPARFLVGTWEANGPAPMEGVGTVNLSLRSTFSPDGSANGQGTLQMQNGFTYSVVLAGRWTTVPVSPTRFTLSFSGTMGVSQGPGMPVQQQPYNETSTVDILDQNTLRDEAGIIQRRVQG